MNNDLIMTLSDQIPYNIFVTVLINTASIRMQTNKVLRITNKHFTKKKEKIDENRIM